MHRTWIIAAACLMSSIETAHAAAAISCSQCASWNEDQAPFRIFANTYYVGTRGLSSVLITSAAGHILIDGALPQSAALIAQHVQQLGFSVGDIKVILNSHAHFDHAGGIAELQRMSGAKVLASDIAAIVLRSGRAERNDPQFGVWLAYPGSSDVGALAQRKTVVLGPLQLEVIHTPGHTPGGTSWTWRSCEGERCLTIVYADSLTPVADRSFKYGGDERYPTAAADLSASIEALGAAACDILITPHPELAGLWSVFDERGKGDRAQLIDAAACKRYAAAAEARLVKRLESERR